MYKKLLLIPTFCLLCLVAFGQAFFEEGYFINEKGEVTNCLINNKDWLNNPTTFDYKLTAEGQVRQGRLETIQEFGIGTHLKYRRATVQLDRSGYDLERLTYNRQPEYREETLFLKVLVKGAASLYQYEEGNLMRFFYQLDDAPIEPLVFKLYYEKDSKLAVENSYYKYQLSNTLPCAEIAISDINALKYNRPSLSDLFVLYNNCVNSDYTLFRKPKKELFQFSITPGISATFIQVTNALSFIFNTDWEVVPAYSIGAALRFALPFNQGRWSMMVEPTYRQFGTTQTEERMTAISSTNTIIESSINYRALELPVGVRYDFFLDQQSHLFGRLIYSNNIPFRSSVNFERVTPFGVEANLVISNNANFSVGIGYQYRDKLSIEMMYHDRRPILLYRNWSSRLSFLSVMVGYSI